MRASIAIVVGLLLLVACAPASAAPLQAGVARADVTPPTGFYTMGYVRSDSVARGQHTRLFARAIVLRSGGRKLALVTTDLGFTPGGMVQEVAQRLARRGFNERNLIISASHTHTAPSGYANFQSDNFVAPTRGTPTEFKTAGDRRLYGFLVKRVAVAIERADRRLGPARAGWGTTTLTGVTDNRSLEAHLANHGLDLPYGTGRLSQDPGGYEHTIDPQVDVLRVDRVARVRRRGRVVRRRIPMGAWLNFADHGTVNPYNFTVYSGDHHGPASRIFERAVRRAGRVPRGREVVGAYGNADAGDMTAALRGRGPAFAEKVGRAEAGAMLRAWRQAGRRMAGAPRVDVRWTRSCFCGRTVSGGRVDSVPAMGSPFFTGSEEGRGPLFEQTGVNHEGHRLPVGVGPQGRKIETVGPPVAEFPTAVPLMVVRVGTGAIATIPGEMSAEMGKWTRVAVQAALRPAGVSNVSLAGYSNEFLHYFVTPEEYDQQHYEGGSTLFGKYTSNLIRDDLALLGTALARGTGAPAPYDFDPRHGFLPDFTPYGNGTAGGRLEAQPPQRVQRMQRAVFKWAGAARGLDRPIDRPFVTVQRRVTVRTGGRRRGGRRGGRRRPEGTPVFTGRVRIKRRWRAVANDLGLQILWRVDEDGRYQAYWQVPRGARLGRYRFVVTANRYTLRSRPFRVGPSTQLRVRALGSGRYRLDYPPVEMLQTLTARPASADGGRVRAQRARAIVRRRVSRGGVFRLPAGATVPKGAARDRFGNRNG